MKQYVPQPFPLESPYVLFFDLIHKNNELILVCPVYSLDPAFLADIQITYGGKRLSLTRQHLKIQHEPIILLFYECPVVSNKDSLPFVVEYKGLTRSYTVEHQLSGPEKTFLLTATTLFKDDAGIFPMYYKYYKEQGVQHFYMYYNGVVNDTIRSIMDKEDVTLIQWDYLYRLDGRPHPFPHHAQLGQLHHAIYAFGKGDSEYMIFNDFDEYFEIPDTTLGSFVSDRRYDLLGFRNRYALTIDGSIPKEFPTKFQKTEPLKWGDRSKNIYKLDPVTTIGVHQAGRADVGIYRIDFTMYHFTNWSQPGRLLGDLKPLQTWSFFQDRYVLSDRKPENPALQRMNYEWVRTAGVNKDTNELLRKSYTDRKIIGEFPYNETILGQLASHRMIWEKALYKCEQKEPAWILILEGHVQFHPHFTDELLSSCLSEIPKNAQMLKFGYIRRKIDFETCTPEHKYWIPLKNVSTYSTVCYAIRTDLLVSLVNHCWTGPVDQLIFPNCYGIVTPEMTTALAEHVQPYRLHGTLFDDAEEFIQGVVFDSKLIYSEQYMNTSVNTRQHDFTNIYKQGTWNKGDVSAPLSGPGSSIENTRDVSKFLQSFIDENKIDSVLDLGCGDLTWISKTAWFCDGSVSYTGVDIVEHLIESHKRTYPSKTFYQRDIVEWNTIPTHSLVILRDILFHCKNSEIQAIFNNLRNKFKYIAFTSCKNEVNNDTFNQWRYADRNVHKAPFQIPTTWHKKFDEPKFQRCFYIYDHNSFYSTNEQNNKVYHKHIHIGPSESQIALIELDKEIPADFQFELKETPFKDTFNVTLLKQTLFIHRTDVEGGWGHPHEGTLYFRKPEENLNLFRVYHYEPKIRLGSSVDGGYVIADMSGYDCYISCGVNNEESFSRDFIAKYNMKKETNFAFDGTIRDYPWNYTREIQWFKKNIGSVNTETVTNLSSITSQFKNIFLKMDIEGWEYPWFASLDDATLLHFKQITLEFHGINDDSWDTEYSKKVEVWKRLEKTHYLIHAHGNNWGGSAYGIPHVVEFTYIRKDTVSAPLAFNTGELPHPTLDAPNKAGVPDHTLNHVPFRQPVMGPMIPNIIHFVFGLREQTEDFLFSFYLSVLSAYVVNKPDTIYFYYHYEPKGIWWEKLKKIPSLVLQTVDLPTHFGAKPILKTAHRADKIRMEVLYDRGGVYMDIDTISVRPYKSLLRNEVVLGIEDTSKDTICNAVMMTIPKSQFFTIWLKNYEANFLPGGWSEASIRLPGLVALKYPSLLTLKEQRTFFYPSYFEVEKIFVEDHDIPNETITLHLWETFSTKYLNEMSLLWILQNPTTLYSRIVKYLLETTDLQAHLLG